MPQFVKRQTGVTIDDFSVWSSDNYYPMIYVNGKSIYAHVFVWEREHGDKPTGYKIHHKDLDKRNYDLSNLELVTKANHQRIHAGWIRVDGQWIAKPCNQCGKVLPLDQFYPRKGYTPSSLCRPCHILKVMEYRAKS